MGPVALLGVLPSAVQVASLIPAALQQQLKIFSQKLQFELAYSIFFGVIFFLSSIMVSCWIIVKHKKGLHIMPCLTSKLGVNWPEEVLAGKRAATKYKSMPEVVVSVQEKVVFNITDEKPKEMIHLHPLEDSSVRPQTLQTDRENSRYLT
ncbi:hypothetical protein GH733_010714 [Mirounga leonina]|nr:hypothetical protein GH733_010714 [Mirounga leonina]